MERLEFDCFPYCDRGKTNNNKRKRVTLRKET